MNKKLIVLGAIIIVSLMVSSATATNLLIDNEKDLLENKKLLTQNNDYEGELVKISGGGIGGAFFVALPIFGTRCRLFLPVLLGVNCGIDRSDPRTKPSDKIEITITSTGEKIDCTSVRVRPFWGFIWASAVPAPEPEFESFAVSGYGILRWYDKI